MSHHGTTRKVAKQIQEKLGFSDSVLIDLSKDQIPNLNDFNTIIVGGSIYMGTMQNKIKEFCIKNQEILLKKRLGFFMCSMNKELKQKSFDESFPEKLRTVAIANGLLGGEIIIKNLGFIEKIIVRMVSGVKEDQSTLDQNAIDQFIKSIKDA